MMTPPESSSGVHTRFKTRSRAHEASTKPKPHSSFQRSETLGSDAEPLCSEVLRRMSRISRGSRVSSAWRRTATMPETTGVAMLVPDFDS